MSLHEVNTAANLIADHCDADANIIFGSVIDDTMDDEMKVTVIAAGFDRGRRSGASTGVEFSPSPGDEDLDIPGFVQG